MDGSITSSMRSQESDEDEELSNLGGVSAALYKEIRSSRTYNEFSVLVPKRQACERRKPERSTSNPKSDAVYSKNETTGLQEHNSMSSSENNELKDIVYGPPGQAPPLRNVPQSEGNHAYFTYTGQWKNGRMHGFGTYRYTDGTVYVGHMRDGWPDGPGKATYADGSEYDGEWKAGRHHGQGTFRYASGSIYAGGWADGRRHGRGRLTYQSGTTCVGDFVGGAMHGRARYASKNLGVAYDGSWERGGIAGYGTLTMPNGEKVMRTWLSRAKHGGGLSVRDALRLQTDDLEAAHIAKLEQREALLGSAIAFGLDQLVNAARCQAAQDREQEKQETRRERMQRRKDAKLMIMDARIKALVKGEEESITSNES